MKHILLFISAFYICGVISAQKTVESYDYNELSAFLEEDLKQNKVQVINFWATWCKPCVKELPYLLDLRQKYREKEVSFIFVSLDFPSQKKSQLLPFVRERSMENDVVLLDDSNSNRWINLVDSTWSGAIPATLFRTAEVNVFHEKTFSSEKEIDNIIHQLIK